ncbi:hypothetical protein [Saccharopolyspora elongata]|uniref:Uncharacterized protein n=1 Tax=Saccharopolyspora elongata TaxID=2530387 RepID=A0A4R4Z9Y8_9PSEU|nr:hypothetical protein [Saccharopolyspora elongata]TDD55118.1 hypothetical protein E1288_04655 [Saccharopolyspora elongata]
MRSVRKTACRAVVLAASAGLLVGGTPASADSADNDGINIGNDNNLSVLPVQLCGNNVGVLGAVAPIGSPQNSDCTNAPIVDHPGADEPPAAGPPADEPPAGQPPVGQPPVGQPPASGPPAGKPPVVKPPSSGPSPSAGSQGGAEDLPVAPIPVAVEGHHAVTG